MVIAPGWWETNVIWDIVNSSYSCGINFGVYGSEFILCEVLFSIEPKVGSDWLIPTQIMVFHPLGSLGCHIGWNIYEFSYTSNKAILFLAAAHTSIPPPVWLPENYVLFEIAGDDTSKRLKLSIGTSYTIATCSEVYPLIYISINSWNN